MDTARIAAVAHAIERQLSHQLDVVESLIATEDVKVARSHLQAHLSVLRSTHGKAATLAQLADDQADA